MTNATDARDAVLLRLEHARSDYLTRARQAAWWLSAGGKRLVSVDDVRAVCPPPFEVDPRVMGAIFKKSQWEAIAMHNSTRRTCHARPIRRFKWVGGQSQ
jgi:hypothetical protein